VRFPRNKQIFRGQLDVAAFASVLFILLIFVLLHSQLIFTPGVPIRLPEAEDLPGVIGDTRIVSVDASGHYYFDNQLTYEKVLRQRLSEEVTASREPLTLVIQADERGNSSRIMQLIVLAHEAGMTNYIWATRPPASSADRFPPRTK
jgi:biopolymer transport protein ExbD